MRSVGEGSTPASSTTNASTSWGSAVGSGEGGGAVSAAGSNSTSARGGTKGAPARSGTGSTSGTGAGTGSGSDSGTASAATTRSSSVTPWRDSGTIAIVSSYPVGSSGTGAAATRGTDGRTASADGVHSAIVSISGVGVAGTGAERAEAAGTVAGDTVGRRGRMHWSITTSSSPGGPSQRMSPLRSTVPPGSRGLSLTWTTRVAPVSWTVTWSSSTTIRAWYGLTAGRSSCRPEPRDEPMVRVPDSGSTCRRPARGPPSTVSEPAFASAITPSSSGHSMGTPLPLQGTG